MPVGGTMNSHANETGCLQDKKKTRLTVRAHANSKALLQATILAAVAIMLRDWTLLVASA